MRLEAVIERVWICTWRPKSSEFGDMHLEAMIVRTWRPRPSEFGGRNRASLEMHLEAVIERVWTSTLRQSMDGAPGAETLFISQLTRNRRTVTR